MVCSCCTSAGKGERSLPSDGPIETPSKVVGEVVEKTGTFLKKEDVCNGKKLGKPEEVKEEKVVEEPKGATQMLGDVLQNSPMLKALAETAGLVEEPKKEVRPEVAAAVEKLKDGIPVKQHKMNGTVKTRLLAISDDETKQMFLPMGRQMLSFGRRDKDLYLKDVKEVRPGTALDPETVGLPKRPKGMVGTPVLRRTSEGPVVARKAFSLILDDRTVDIECDDPDQCAILVSAFQLLVANAQHPISTDSVQQQPAAADESRPTEAE